MSDSAVIQLSKQLIQKASITPDDQGCQQMLAELLAKNGFQIEHQRFGKVDNLFAWHGDKPGKNLMFLGHTDVVPTGDPELWRHPPFGAHIEDGYLYGRGAADMKSAVAAFTLAMINHVNANPDHKGQLSLMLTSDEEGPAQDGVKKMMPHVSRQHHFDYCLVGEPSSSKKLGDVVRVGRRGSLHVVITIHGVQGHVAYPQHAENPVFSAAPLIADLGEYVWDEGNDDFPPTSFQISSLKTSSNTANIIPGDLRIQANYRYSPESSQDSLAQQLTALLDKHQLRYSLQWSLSGLPFHSKNAALKTALANNIAAISHESVTFNTAGGTSDGRFVAPHGVEVVELGVVNKTIHRIDERVLVTEVQQLQSIYEGIIAELLS